MTDQPSADPFAVELRNRFIKDFLDMLILQLVKNKPVWGYMIIKETETKYGVKLRHGALYPMLSMLEAKSLINSRRELKKGRIRKVYEITKEGERLLQLYRDFLMEQTTKKRTRESA